MGKVIVYLRVSTSEQKTDSQRVAIEGYLKARGIAEYEVYEDEGISGSRQSRPALDRLMADIEAGTVLTVITYSLSRLSRSVSHLLRVLERFEAHQVGFVSVTENLDLSTPAGRLLLTILGSIAQFEREIIVARVCAGLDAAKKRGTKLGRPRTRNSQLIRSLHAQKMSLRKIASVAGCSLATVQAELAAYGKDVLSIRPPVTA